MRVTRRTTYRVRLEERVWKILREMIDGGRGSKERRRAHNLLLADGGRSDTDIADILGAGTATVERVRRQCTMEGPEAALERKEQINRKPRLACGRAEAKLTMVGLLEAHEGHAGWNLRLPGNRLVELENSGEISNETVRRSPRRHPQTLAEDMLVHSTEGECRFRLRHGGCAGGLWT